MKKQIILINNKCYNKNKKDNMNSNNKFMVIYNIDFFIKTIKTEINNLHFNPLKHKVNHQIAVASNNNHHNNNHRCKMKNLMMIQKMNLKLKKKE